MTARTICDAAGCDRRAAYRDASGYVLCIRHRVVGDRRIGCELCDVGYTPRLGRNGMSFHLVGGTRQECR